jgi:putative transposase
MLTNLESLSLEFLNQASQAWIELEYNRKLHQEIGMSPLERMLKGTDVSRPAPESAKLHFAFTTKERRSQRRSDGTVSIKGIRFEVPSAYRHFENLFVRYQSFDLSMAYLVDKRTDELLCRIYPQDKTKNANGYRRTLDPVSEDQPPHKSTQDPIPPLLRKIMSDYAATGLPPAYLPKEERLAATDPKQKKKDNRNE